MAKRTTSKVVPIETARQKKSSKPENLLLAQDKVYAAWEAKGKTRTKLAKEALVISEDCADAYLILADDLKNPEERIKLYRKAVKAGQRALGRNFEKEYEGGWWGATETRPVMRAMARLAVSLQWEEELTEALEIYRKLMALNPNDNQGIRYLLANALYEAGCDEELDKLLSEYPNDPSAALLYTKALHLFRKSGPSNPAVKALNKAFQHNKCVPVFLSDIVEMPSESPTDIGIGDDSEAIAYVLDHGYLWGDTEGAMDWMSDTLAQKMHQAFEDRKLVDEVLRALKGQYDD